MNQIIFNKKVNKKIRTIFIIQFVSSVIMASLFSILIYSKIKNNAELEKVSYVISSKIKLESFYNTEKVDSNNIYFGKIYIRKINLEYIVFDMINEELTNSEVRSIINSKLDDFIKEKEFEKRVREITSDALEKFFKMMYNKRGFWKSEVKNV